MTITYVQYLHTLLVRRPLSPIVFDRIPSPLLDSGSNTFLKRGDLPRRKIVLMVLVRFKVIVSWLSSVGG